MIATEEELDEFLSRPRQPLIEMIKQVQNPLMVLGASGKMGPSLCWLARRAAEAAHHDLKILAVSRFSDSQNRSLLESRGIETIGCDLLDQKAVERLPAAQNVIYLVGLKFGTTQNPSLTWAVNTLAPSYATEHYSDARIVVLSTGNVYPFLSPSTGGATEQTPPAPLGEYASAALARERIFEYYSRTRGTPLVVLRLNYAVELRYGVLLDIAQKVWNGDAVDLASGYLNCLWQGDANDMILRALRLATTPPAVYNLTGQSTLSVRELAARFGEIMGRPPHFTGKEADTALLSNPSRLLSLLGAPTVGFERVLEWTAHWVMRGSRTLGKPTHFDERRGAF